MGNQQITEEQLALTQLDQKQQQIDNDPNAIYADTLRKEGTANLLDQLNPDNLLVDIEHRIRGEKKDPYSNKWIPISKDQKPISEKLVSNFISFLGSILNQNTSMSNFSADEINNMMHMIVTYIGIDLDVNDEVYGIKGDYPEMWRIAHIISISCFSTFKQAMNGMLSKRIFGSLKVDAHLTDTNKSGVQDALAFWRWSFKYVFKYNTMINDMFTDEFKELVTEDLFNSMEQLDRIEFQNNFIQQNQSLTISKIIMSAYMIMNFIAISFSIYFSVAFIHLMSLGFYSDIHRQGGVFFFIIFIVTSILFLYTFFRGIYQTNKYKKQNDDDINFILEELW